MTEPVRQELSLDAQAAIAELKRLRTELLAGAQQLIGTGQAFSNFNQQASSFERFARASGGAAQQFAGGLGGLNPELATTITRLSAVKQLIKEFERDTKNAADGVTVSWKSVTRIFVASAIRQAIFGVIGEIKSLVGESN